MPDQVAQRIIAGLPEGYQATWCDAQTARIKFGPRSLATRPRRMRLRPPKRTALAKAATSLKDLLFKENTVLLRHTSTRLIKYQIVLVGKVDLPQKLLPSEYNFESRVLSIIFQIHYLRRDISPEGSR